MGISIFPAMGQPEENTETFSFLIPDNTTRYSFPIEITPGSYTVTCPSTTNLTIYFHKNEENNPTAFTKQTVSGQVTFILEDTYNFISALIDTGTNITATFTRNGGYSSSRVGTIDTITTTGTYNQTGNGIVIAIGGGQAGTDTNGGTPSSAGGHSGMAQIRVMKLPGSIPVIVGAGGSRPAGHGGDTQFLDIVAKGGSPNNIGSSGGGGAPGRPSTNPGLAGGGGGSDGTPGSGLPISPHGIVMAGAGGAGGLGSIWPGNSRRQGIGGGGGGIYGGGGGGGSGHFSYGGGAGGGGGGGFPGNSGAPGGLMPYVASGGNGGAGAVYVLRFPS